MSAPLRPSPQRLPHRLPYGCAVARRLAWLLALLGAPASAGWPFAQTLAEVVTDTERAHPALAQIAPAELQAARRAGTPLRLVDVREPAEYAVSHLPGAIRVDPEADAATLLAALGPLPAGTQVVLYCSVGVRSSLLAERVAAPLRAAGAAAVANLRGGAFAWHGARLPLVDRHGATDAIHGYDRRWRRLIPRQDAPIVIDR